ncbi:MAG: acyl-CoA desaturase [Holosporales bacterium]|jgi:fatty-acid desaturase
MTRKHSIDEPRFTATASTDAVTGRVIWSWRKSAWVGGMYALSLIGGFYTFSLEAFLVFILSTATVLCFGHSLGMHRRLIHNSFKCPLWLEYILVYSGTLVGLGGPFTMIYTHDLRDWAQRQPACHDYFAHRQPFWKDWFWQLHCDIHLVNPPAVQYEQRIVNNEFYHFIERTTMAQQLPWALLFYAVGGMSWVIWGVCVRVAVCVTGHWLIGYFAHLQGDREWHVHGAGVQGYNVAFCGLITSGECWHNNHHAFPGSAKIGIHKHQIDPGWWVITILRRLGLAWDIQTPATLPERSALQRL